MESIIDMNGLSPFTWVALGGYGFAALFIWLGYYQRAKLRRLLGSASVAKGTVVALEKAISMSSDSVDPVFHPVFNFRDAQGVEHRVRSKVGSFPATHKVGDPVDVFYQPQSPDEAIMDVKSHILMARICVFGGLGAAVFATVILIFELRSG
jgi:hypothetical protein